MNKLNKYWKNKIIFLFLLPTELFYIQKESILREQQICPISLSLVLSLVVSLAPLLKFEPLLKASLKVLKRPIAPKETAYHALMQRKRYAKK